MMSTNNELLALLNKTLKVDATMANASGLQNAFWSTGILPFDALLGGGFQKGRMALLAGESATLKSMIGLATAGQVLKAGGTAAIIDAEHAFNPDWAANLGVDLDKLIISRPENGESAIDQMEVLVRNDIDYICLDSIATLLPTAERDFMLSGTGNVQPARIAALMAIALRKLNTANQKTTIVWISQMRDNLGAMAFSPKSVITGGKSIHYYVSQSVKLTKVGKLNAEFQYFNGDKNASDKQIVIQQFKAELSKSRNTQPFQIQHFNFDLRNGEIDIPQYLIQQGLDMGFVTRPNNRTWEVNIANTETGEVIREASVTGKEAFALAVRDDADMQADMIAAVAARYNLDPEIYK
jgi:recombination protein RecA